MDFRLAYTSGQSVNFRSFRRHDELKPKLFPVVEFTLASVNILSIEMLFYAAVLVHFNVNNVILFNF